MTALVAIRPAPRLDSYPLLPDYGEILPVVRAEACACGGYVRQCLGDSVARAVRTHQGTQIHAAWRERTP